MNENRLVDMILWGVMLVGGAILGLVYLTTPSYEGVGLLTRPGAPMKKEMRRTQEQGLGVPLIAETPKGVAQAREVPKSGAIPSPQPPDEGAGSSNAHKGNEPSIISKKISSPPAASTLPKQEVLPGGKSEGDVAGPEHQTTSLPAARGNMGALRPFTSGPAKVTLHETTKPNGTLFSAQEVGEGTIVGKRGAADDSADFYRIRATGKRLELRLEPTVKDHEGRFVMIVFDESQKPLGDDSGKPGAPLSFEVTPQSSYYVKLDLKTAPVEIVPYQLHIKFE